MIFKGGKDDSGKIITFKVVKDGTVLDGNTWKKFFLLFTSVIETVNFLFTVNGKI